MDETNPAVGKQLQIPPAMLEAIAGDSKVAASTARKVWLVQMDQMHRRLRAPDAPLSAKQAFIDHLAKVADIVPKQAAGALAAAGAGFSVNINFSTPQPPRALTRNLPNADTTVTDVVDMTPAPTPVPAQAPEE